MAAEKGSSDFFVSTFSGLTFFFCAYFSSLCLTGLILVGVSDVKVPSSLLKTLDLLDYRSWSFSFF